MLVQRETVLQLEGGCSWELPWHSLASGSALPPHRGPRGTKCDQNPGAGWWGGGTAFTLAKPQDPALLVLGGWGAGHVYRDQSTGWGEPV